MNKTKTILAAVGGTTLVAVLAAGYFAWCQQSAKTAALEGDDEGAVGLETVRSKAERLTRNPVYPGAESVKALADAREALVAWKDEALALASRGDRRIDEKSDAAFKEFILSDSRRLLSLPAGEDRKTLVPTFDFGPFKPYIAENKPIEKDLLNDLQRKWDDIATIIETLSANGVDSISAIDAKTAAPKTAEEEAKPKKGKTKAKAKAKAKTAEPAFQPAACTYVVSCKARPDALVKVLNALATSERFMVVGDLSIVREKDLVSEGLGVAEKKDEAAPMVRRRKRGGMAVEAESKPAEKPAEEELFTTVSDPVAEPPLETKLTVTVYDFRTFEKNKEEGVEK